MSELGLRNWRLRRSGADPPNMTKTPPLSEDAATVLGLAGTALAFTCSTAEEVERWIRALRLYGEAGLVLQAVGVGEAPARSVPPSDPDAGAGFGRGEETIARVLDCAAQFARKRGVPAVGTTDLLLAVMRVYGEAFDEALEARGTDRVELIERLEGDLQAPLVE